MMQTLLDSVALHVPTILLPRSDIDLSTWAVIACDQYTSQPDYWQQIADLAADKPSTLHLILPEIYLDRCTDEYISRINRCMHDYLERGLLVEQPPGLIRVDRRTPHAASRKGLMVALDLEHYDYRPGSASLIRASEGTIIERLPPRVSVRRDAPLELPHIMVLIDDPGHTVIEPLFEHFDPLLYDIELMMQAGHVQGCLVTDPVRIASVARALQRCRGTGADAFLYAVGDGNHSLATAKNIWESLKQSTKDQAALMRHPARYALVELVNLHDPGLLFEPIYRVLFNIAAEKLSGCIEEYFQRQGTGSRLRTVSAAEAAAVALESGSSALHRFGWVSSCGCGIAEIENPGQVCATGTLQDFLDAFVQDHPGSLIDYVHGGDVVAELGCRQGNAGFYLPSIAKADLFRTIMLQGALPRKTFSMGSAEEKRFYLECRRIR
jgi:hypothetical protein